MALTDTPPTHQLEPGDLVFARDDGEIGFIVYVRTSFLGTVYLVTFPQRTEWLHRHDLIKAR